MFKSSRSTLLSFPSSSKYFGNRFILWLKKKYLNWCLIDKSWCRLNGNRSLELTFARNWTIWRLSRFRRTTGEMLKQQVGVKQRKLSVEAQVKYLKSHDLKIWGQRWCNLTGYKSNRSDQKPKCFFIDDCVNRSMKGWTELTQSWPTITVKESATKASWCQGH